MKKISKNVLSLLFVSFFAITYSCKKEAIEIKEVLDKKGTNRNLKISANFQKNGAYNELLKDIIKLNKANSKPNWKFIKSSDVIIKELSNIKNKTEIDKILDSGISNSKEFKLHLYKTLNSFELFVKENPELLKTKEGENTFVNEFKTDLLALRKAEFKKLKISTYGWCYGDCNGQYWYTESNCDVMLAVGMSAAGYQIITGVGSAPGFMTMVGVYFAYTVCDANAWYSYTNCVNGCPI